MGIGPNDVGGVGETGKKEDVSTSAASFHGSRAAPRWHRTESAVTVPRFQARAMAKKAWGFHSTGQGGGGHPVTVTLDRTLRSLEGVRPLYMLPENPLAEEVLIPGFQAAGKVDCMVGFFSSEVLASLAPGLATYITGSENSFRLVVSPLLRAEDQAAIEDGLKSPEEVADRTFEELTVTEDLLQRHTLKCLSWLLRAGRIEIKIALMKDALFHPKVWLFENGSDLVAAHGSSNVTHAGIHKNIEQIAISRSWQDPNQRYIVDKLRFEFYRLWDNKDDSCIVIGLPEAVRQRLLRTYTSETPPTDDELRALYGRATGIAEEPVHYEPPSVSRASFTIPDWLRYEEGPFEHQGRAVAAWCEAGYRGILEMATGSGKTITSMIGAHRFSATSRNHTGLLSKPARFQ